MTGLVLQWRAPAPPFVLQWRGPSGVLEAISRLPQPSLAGFVVPGAVLPVTEGDGIDIIGGEIRINIEELPSA